MFGYFGYIMVRGFFDRHVIDMLIGAVMALCFAYQFTVLLPQAGIGWQATSAAWSAGIVGGWIFRDRRAARTAGAAVKATGTTATGTAQARASVPAPVAQPGTSLRPATGSKAAAKYAGPRADLYKELDDLGL